MHWTDIFANSDRCWVISQMGIEYQIDSDRCFGFYSLEDKQRAIRGLKNALLLT